MKLQCTREQLSGSDDTPILGFQLHGDALAAHAYQQAIQDAGEECLVWDDITEWIESRAEELMKEWTK